jgi:2-keto-myo-inositol isomerase
MIPCVAQACVLPTPYDDDLAAAAEAGITHLELWLTKLEQYLKTESPDAARRIMTDRGLSCPVAAYQGGFLLAQGDARRAAIDLLKRRLELCQFFGVQTLLLVADFAGPADASALGRAVASLAEAGRWAAAFDCRVALEFRAETAACTCLETAALIAAETGEANVGVCSDIARAIERIVHVQLTDAAGIPREFLQESDRILPGEGDFETAGLMSELKAAGYAGTIGVELFNPMLWKAKPRQVYELARASLAGLLR